MRFATFAFILAISSPLAAQSVPLLTDGQITALSGEISGESAKRNLEGFSRLHRMRGSRDFHRAVEQIMSELQKYGYADAHVENDVRGPGRGSTPAGAHPGKNQQ